LLVFVLYLNKVDIADAVRDRRVGVVVLISTVTFYTRVVTAALVYDEGYDIGIDRFRAVCRPCRVGASLVTGRALLMHAYHVVSAK